MIKKFFTTSLIVFVIVVAIVDGLKFLNRGNKNNLSMKLHSPAFSDNQFIPSKFTCDGNDTNPELDISNVPSGAKSLVLIMDDSDAPAGIFVHWTVWNIDPNTDKITENIAPEGTEGLTSADKPGYVGPCPHQGTHHYNFKLYALDTLLNLKPSSKKEDLEKAMGGHILDQASLSGLYKRG